MRHRFTAALAGLAALAMWPAAMAQSTVQVDWFEPWYGQGSSTLNTARTDLLGHLRPSFGLFFHVADDLVVEHVVDSEGNERTQTVLGESFKLELSAGLGLFDWVDVGIVLPLVPSQGITGAPLTLPGAATSGDFSLQDVRLSVRGRFLKPEQAAGFGLGLALTAYLPTGDDAAFTSDGAARFEPRLLADWRHDSGVMLALNLGLQFRPEQALYNVVSSQSFRWNVAGQVPLGVDGLDLLVSVFGAVALTESLDPEDLEREVDSPFSKPAELTAGVQYVWSKASMVFSAGGGTGLSEGMGAPLWRAFLNVAYTPLERDRDGDGILDNDDACPDDPEDKDTFEDDNGCPDPDNDQDGVLDVDDKCPLDPEDPDDFEDEDGCPDPDNDKDGILDADDQCPNVAEDVDTFEDSDGCLDADNDNDGILDEADKCPLEPEDVDDFFDEDGCPDPDNDDDDILDVNDTCPNKPETVNGFQDEDGCPDDKNAKVQVTKNYITIKGKVHFATAKARIKKKSFKLLGEVAQVLKDNKQITKLRIEGHTDNRGPDAYNLKLSDQRAHAVRDFLIAMGIDPARLEAKGYGEERPKASNRTGKGRAENRRVDFFIREINGKSVDPDAKVETGGDPQ